MSTESELSSIQDQESLHEIRAVLNAISGLMATPLFLVFWIADIIYVPQFKFPFLLLRCSIIPLNFLVSRMMKSISTLKSAERIACLYAIANAAVINVMIFMIKDPTTSYYAGLNLVAIGGLSFIPLSLHLLSIAVIAIYGPYLIFAISTLNNRDTARAMAVNAFFMVGTIVICMVIRFFNSRLRAKEVSARQNLQEELLGREKIIHEKTAEAVRLHGLSVQFSPQVVRAIREGTLDINKGVHRSQICAVFVDIVNSTDRVVRLDPQKVDLVLGKFMDTVVSIYLKFDLTIDKFHGDGLLAFANDPIRHADFVARACEATLEVFSRLRADREFYVQNWKQEMQIRAGIAVGYANVGFYGSKRLFHTYTAIGRPLPLAARMTGMAEPNQILVDHDVVSALEPNRFELRKIGEKTIRGFDEDRFILYELKGDSQVKNEIAGDAKDLCPQCPNSVLYIDTTLDGLYVMKCHSCGYVAQEVGPTFNPRPAAA